MAEIKVERKERSVWPWVIGALILLGLIWFFFLRPAGVEPEPATLPDTTVGVLQGGVNDGSV